MLMKETMVLQKPLYTQTITGSYPSGNRSLPNHQLMPQSHSLLTHEQHHYVYVHLDLCYGFIQHVLVVTMKV